jgi:glycosyltransferase involved in cell wall biosynthesis
MMSSRAATAPSSRHVVASIGDRGAGTSYTVRALTRAMASLGASVDVHSVRGWRGGDDPELLAGVVGHTIHPQDLAALPILRRACFSDSLDQALRAAAATTDVLHGHGLWLMPNVYPARAARRGSAKLVISPHGMLGAAALAFSSRGKTAFWRLFQKDALQQAACLHATCDAEHAEIRAAGLANPVAVIPNGVDLPALDGVEDPGRPRTVLCLGRIHPKKGLDQLVRAWAQVEPTRPQWRLRIVGPAELSHDRQLMALSQSLGLRRVSIEGPAFGTAKLAAYRDADLFVLASRNENFAITVAEALAAGAPVIATRGAPWAGLDAAGCGWWLDQGGAPLAAALVLATATPRAELDAMGRRGRAWMSRDFGWDRIGADMLDVYRWLTTGAERPASVRLT